MAKNRKSKVEPVEQSASDLETHPIYVGPRGMAVCDSCAEKLRGQAHIVVLDPVPSAASDIRSGPHPTVAVAALVFLLLLAGLIVLGLMTVEQYWPILCITLISVLVVPYGVAGLQRLLKRFLP